MPLLRRLTSKWLMIPLALLASIIAVAVSWALLAVPSQMQFTIAAMSTCGLDTLKAQDPGFRPDVWDPALGLLYRWKVRALGTPGTYDEGTEIASTDLHILIAQSGVKGCEPQMLKMIDEAIARGAPIDAYDAWGATPLQMAFLYRKPAIVTRLLAAGADRSLPIRNPTAKFSGQSVVALSDYIAAQPHAAQWAATRAALLQTRPPARKD